MHIDPISPIRTAALPGEQPIQHGAPGSAARLAVLLYLARRPDGADRATLAAVVGLGEPSMAQVLKSLRQDQRIACDRADGERLWFVPAARAKRPATDGSYLRGLTYSDQTSEAGE